MKKTLAFLIFALIATFSKAQNYPDAVNPDWRNEIPEVIYPDSELVNLYYNTWEIAAGRVRRGPEGLPASPYLDENCYDDQIWIWDACFMVMFSKYAPSSFPGKQTLENLYQPILENRPTPLRVHLRDNPPIFAWTELSNYLFVGDKQHINYLLYDKKYLQRHFDYFNNIKKGDYNPAISPNKIRRDVVRKNGEIIGYTWDGGASGMDNTVRGREAGGYDKIAWIDAISQQALSALSISRLFKECGDKENARLWTSRYDSIKSVVNKYYWDEQDGFYYDLNLATEKPCRVMTSSSFWPMLAEIPSREQAERMVRTLRDSMLLGGTRPWVSLSRNDKDFNAKTGDYWRGGIWLPLAYMGTKALEKYGYTQLADSLAKNIVLLQKETYKSVEPHTIWECYSPSENKPSTEYGRICRTDFCGWSALGPISLFIENVIGISTVNALNKTVNWRLDKKIGTLGIKRLRVGDATISMIYESDKNRIKLNATSAFTLVVNGKKYKVKQGDSLIALKK